MTNPVITVNNNSSHDVYVDGDPNWDDQVLHINGKRVHSVYTLAQGLSIEVSVNWEGPGDELMLGVIFADAAQYDYGSNVGFYQLSFGQAPATGNLDVTDSYINGEPQVQYSVADQTPWSMTMTFVDAAVAP